MSISKVLMDSCPTSYWPLDDSAGSATVRDEKGRHAGVVMPHGVTLSAVPFGASLMPLFDGSQDSVIRIPDDDRYSHTFTNSLTVSCWICPHTLIFPNSDGSTDKYVHFIDKGIDYSHGSEWAM